ncbi:MAG: transcriptional regulator [Spirochaetales bacterium]|nr:transcriptional regulator [Spirochaetales bacterium]
MDHDMIDKETAWNELVASLTTTSDQELMDSFLKSILTEYEIDEVAKRWALVRLLDKGVSQRTIAKNLGLSLCKITRGSKELKREKSPFVQMIKMHR